MGVFLDLGRGIRLPTLLRQVAVRLAALGLKDLFFGGLFLPALLVEDGVNMTALGLERLVGDLPLVTKDLFTVGATGNDVTRPSDAGSGLRITPVSTRAWSIFVALVVGRASGQSQYLVCFSPAFRDGPLGIFLGLLSLN